MRQTIANTLGVHQPLDTGRYLGLPSLIGRSKKEIFCFLRDRLWKRIQGWNGKNLSKAGKEIMIKAVAQAIPAYSMACFLLPVSLTDVLEKMMNSFWWGNNTDERRGVNWMCWDRMCTSKVKGGLNFRSLQLFNLAMLGKMGWRLLSDPDALVCKVLKAKYFPRGDFLSAEVGHSPSFTWRSIWASQDLVRKGMRWRIGDGSRIRVFHDPWLRRDQNFYVTTAIPSELSDLKVCDLIIPRTQAWDREHIDQIFNEEDAKQILNIPLSMYRAEDRRIWHFSKTGSYSVKSAYKVACSLTLDNAYMVEGNWNTIWKLKVPPRVKICLWRSARRALPTKANLLRRGVHVESECGICLGEYETEWHLFVTCPFARECWSQTGIDQTIQAAIESSESFKELLFGLLQSANEDVRTKVAMIIWQIWKDRNSAVWNGVFPTPVISCNLAISFRKEWLEAQG